MSRYTTIFFDLDDTLYDNKNGLWDAIRFRMNEYLQNLLQLPADQTTALRHFYYQKYGTTLRGLQIHHQVNADDYLAYVHNLPLENFIQPDPELHRMLSTLPQRKFIFTNADSDHATRILNLLDIYDCFDGIIDVRSLDFHCKPEEIAYWIALKLAGENDPIKCVYLDDSTRNLSKARELGFTTILVCSDGKASSAHLSITNVKELPIILPDLGVRA